MSYWPVESVNESRFNPVLWLRIVTWAPVITAPLGSGTVPKTLATSVCGHAHTGSRASDKTKRKHAHELKNAAYPRQPDEALPSRIGKNNLTARSCITPPPALVCHPQRPL